MNSLSWFLYLADVIPNFSILFGLLSGGAAVAAGISLMAWGDKVVQGKVPVLFIFSSVLAASIASSIPSKQTIYLIAGSEAGETVVTSQEGQEILNDVKAIIKQQLANMKAE